MVERGCCGTYGARIMSKLIPYRQHFDPNARCSTLAVVRWFKAIVMAHLNIAATTGRLRVRCIACPLFYSRPRDHGTAPRVNDRWSSGDSFADDISCLAPGCTTILSIFATYLSFNASMTPGSSSRMNKSPGSTRDLVRSGVCTS